MTGQHALFLKIATLLAFAVVAIASMAQTEAADSQADEIVVGSKKFTEAVILGEMLTQLAEAEGFEARHRDQLGGTRVLWNALVGGEIDVYAEYTGTLLQEIFAGRVLGPEDLPEALAEFGLAMTPPFGFNNTYAIGMRRETADALGIRTISDLSDHPELRFGFTNEFLDRGDGWPSLRQRYGLNPESVTGLDHDLAYRGLEGGDIEVIDLYSTDAEIGYYDLAVLDDDLGHFPAYKPVALYRRDLPAGLAEAFGVLDDRISDDAMVTMNGRTKIQHVPEAQVANDFLRHTLGVSTTARVAGRSERIWQRSREHLLLVGLSLGLAILVAIPLGIAAAKLPRLGQWILGAVGLLQTVPSLALLVFMIPLLGIGAPPALAALFLYSLLPIVRNTHAGLLDIAPELRESADALGLPPSTVLRYIELPLAARSILAGIKTSAVINIGTATLGALIGAGGYGQPILTGIRLDNISLILEGAVPAALLAVLVQWLFEIAERHLIPAGLRP